MAFGTPKRIKAPRNVVLNTKDLEALSRRAASARIINRAFTPAVCISATPTKPSPFFRSLFNTLKAEEINKAFRPGLAPPKPRATVVLVPMSPAVATAASISGQGVFAATVMAGVAYVPAPVPRLIAVEVVELHCSAFRHRPSVSVVRVIAVVHVAIESATAVKPWTGSQEHSTSKPVGPVVPVRGAIVGCIVEIPIRAYRRHSNFDANLSRPLGWNAEQGNRKY